MESIVWSSFFHHSDNNTKATNAFGEFVTLTQQDSIRGCMGWWNDDFRQLSGRDLGYHFAESLRQAMDVDGRSIRFRQTDFYGDPTSKLNFQAMLLPVRNITQEFSNRRQGIILSQNHGGNKRATFLPGVFMDNPGLDNVLSMLVQKAGNPTHFRLIGYKTRSIRWDAVDTLKKARPFLRVLCENIADSIMDVMHRNKKVPYILRPNETKWDSDDSQHVRNLSCVRLLESYYDISILTTQMSKRAQGDPHAMVYITPDRVDYDALDDEFGKPQLLIALPSKFKKHQIHIPWEIIEKSIFAWNWWAQVISLNRLDAYYHRLVEIAAHFTPQETNEVAVLFEGSAALFRVHPPIQALCIRSLQELGNRRRLYFYMFNDGTCRLDITCHVLNGLIYLTRKKR